MSDQCWKEIIPFLSKMWGYFIKLFDRMTSPPLVWSEDLIHVPGPRSNPGESCALKSGGAGIRSRFLDLDRILADAKEHWGARDSIHAPGHGSNPGRCKRVGTLPMSYRNGENLWKSIKKKEKVERLG